MNATTIPAALRDLLDHDLPLLEAIDRHFVSKYVQCTNGAWDDRAGFEAHIAHLRTLVQRIEVTLVEELRQAERYAGRHIVRLEKIDGSVVTQEVFVFARFAADGRFSCIEEVTNMLEGAEADRGIGTAR